MSNRMTITLPAWTHAFPTKSGTYLVADEYGRVSMLDIRSVSKDGLARCSDGTHILTPTDWFCGPLTRDSLFTPDVIASVAKAWDDLLPKKLAAAEDEVRRHPRSPNAKANLESVKAEIERFCDAKGGAS